MIMTESDKWRMKICLYATKAFASHCTIFDTEYAYIANMKYGYDCYGFVLKVVYDISRQLLRSLENGI